jgi:8-amino-7-oxononanoate synthase
MPPAADAITAALAAGLADLDARSRRRRLREIAGPQGSHVEVDGRRMLLACSNDYLGLAADPRLIQAAGEGMQRWGFGAGASRLISGSMAAHHALEAQLAAWKGSEAALLFNSGWHANVGTIAALVGPADIVYSDELNHASLIDGCRLSRATVRVYAHADAGALDGLLSADRARGGRRLVVTDSVFSMEGDEAPLGALVEVCERHGASLMVDEAHATGLLGPDGQGLVAELGLRDRVMVQMGTLGKALGSFGAYIAGSQTLIDWLVNRARSFVFTTALPPAVAAATGEAVRIVQSEPERRAHVLALAAELRSRLASDGWQVLPGRLPIIPVVIGPDDATMALAGRLAEAGILATGIRPPTVPEGTSRIRLTLTAAHSAADIGAIAAAFRSAR